MKVFVISGMGEFDEVIFSGHAGRSVKQGSETYTYVDGKGPYHAGFVFNDTPENRKLFADYVAKRKKIERELSSEMFSVLNAMRKG